MLTRWPSRFQVFDAVSIWHLVTGIIITACCSRGYMCLLQPKPADAFITPHCIYRYSVRNDSNLV